MGFWGFGEIIGLLTSAPTYVDFYLKVGLFLVECQKLQYTYDYSKVYEQIRTCHSEK